MLEMSELMGHLPFLWDKFQSTMCGCCAPFGTPQGQVIVTKNKVRLRPFQWCFLICLACFRAVSHLFQTFGYLHTHTLRLGCKPVHNWWAACSAQQDSIALSKHSHTQPIRQASTDAPSSRSTTGYNVVLRPATHVTQQRKLTH